jgi:hypothetical protein
MDREDATAAKAEQYQRWRKLRLDTAGKSGAS